MHTIGLLGSEFDECLKILKVRIEDLGHHATVINLTHLPRVIRATVEFDRLICDGYNLFEMGSFYLKEMGIRDPFFHITYARELWAMLRERYLAFAETEVENIRFTCSLLEILATRVPVVNHPRVYAYRALLPYQLHLLALHGFSVPSFVTGFAAERADYEDSGKLPLSLDEERTWDVLSFQKGKESGLRLWRDKPAGTTYRLVVIGDVLFDHGLASLEEESDPRRVELEEVPSAARDTALNCARTMEVSFGEITLKHSEDEGKVWVLQIDPSPDLYTLETTHRLQVSEPLAAYLVGKADRLSH